MRPVRLDGSPGLTEARVVIEDFRQDYNSARPHSALGYQSPQRFAAQLPPAIALVGLRPPSAQACQTHPFRHIKPTSRTNIAPGPESRTPSLPVSIRRLHAATRAPDTETGEPGAPPAQPNLIIPDFVEGETLRRR